MSGPITFFKPRAGAPAAPGAAEGETCEIEVAAPDGALRLYFYAAQPLDPQLVDGWRAAAAGGAQHRPEAPGAEIQQQVWQALQRGLGGVLVWTIDAPGRQRRAGVWPAPREGEAPFKTFGLLAAGFPLRCEEIGDRPVELPLGSHLFVPVDRDAEAHLWSFQRELAWLPPDVESQVLHAIRRPSLDARLTQIESRLSAAAPGASAPGAPTAMSVPSRWARWRRRLTEPWRRLRGGRPWPVLAFSLLAALLLIDLLLLLRLGERLDALGGRGDTTAARGAAHNAARAGERQTRDGTAADSTGRGTAAPTAGALLGEVTHAVHAQRATSAALGALDAGHFGAFAGKSDREITHLLGEPATVRPLALGVMKLEALRFDPAGSQAAFYRTPGNLSELKATLKRLAPSLAADANASSLLAACACLAYGGRGSPSLPKANGVPALELAVGASCASFPPETAVPGLTDLAAYLRDGNRTAGAAAAP